MPDSSVWWDPDDRLETAQSHYATPYGYGANAPSGFGIRFRYFGESQADIEAGVAFGADGQRRDFFSIPLSLVAKFPLGTGTILDYHTDDRRHHSLDGSGLDYTEFEGGDALGPERMEGYIYRRTVHTAIVGYPLVKNDGFLDPDESFIVKGYVDYRKSNANGTAYYTIPHIKPNYSFGYDADGDGISFLEYYSGEYRMAPYSGIYQRIRDIARVDRNSYAAFLNTSTSLDYAGEGLASHATNPYRSHLNPAIDISLFHHSGPLKPDFGFYKNSGGFTDDYNGDGVGDAHNNYEMIGEDLTSGQFVKKHYPFDLDGSYVDETLTRSITIGVGEGLSVDSLVSFTGLRRRFVLSYTYDPSGYPMVEADIQKRFKTKSYTAEFSKNLIDNRCFQIASRLEQTIERHADIKIQKNRKLSNTLATSMADEYLSGNAPDTSLPEDAMSPQQQSMADFFEAVGSGDVTIGSIY